MRLIYTILILLAALFISIGASAQKVKDNTLSIAYYGEMITHPGFRIGMDVPVGTWGKEKQNQIFASPSIGMFHHRRYQTSFFVMPDFALKKKTKKGLEYSFGIGIGYQVSIVPNTYFITPNDSVMQVSSNQWYFLANAFFALQKTIFRQSEKPLKVYIKPQMTYAYPNFPTRVGYFMLELGCKYDISI